MTQTGHNTVDKYEFFFVRKLYIVYVFCRPTLEKLS